MTQEFSSYQFVVPQEGRVLSLQETQREALLWFAHLRTLLCDAFEAIEQDGAGHGDMDLPCGMFKKKKWRRAGGKGGGEAALMNDGRVFEKVGVNISCVEGEFSPLMQKEVRGASKHPHFWAAGISVVAHMRSPYIPAFHMNTRLIKTNQDWFGGGMDLTPMMPKSKQAHGDTKIFHTRLKELCAPFGDAVYEDFSSWCARYFYLPHRFEERGAGGIFYDHLLNANDALRARHFEWTKKLGETFLHVTQELIRARLSETWSAQERIQQCQRRGRYAEFNLLYDRGTKFGLMTGGSVDAILMSLPPEVHWR